MTNRLAPLSAEEVDPVFLALAIKALKIRVTELEREVWELKQALADKVADTTS